MTLLEIRELSCRLGSREVLRGVDLDLGAGEVVALLGPSGSGKTTLLRIVGGFETRYRGSVRFAGEALEGVPPERRRFGMVFQHYALFPHLSAGENVAFGLRGRPREEIDRRVREALGRVDLAGFEDRRIGELSGGQQQRVALARALAPEPRLLLLDEPLSNLDPQLRERTRRELAELLQALAIPTLLVTHEQEEAFELGHRVAVLQAGTLEQVGTPLELYFQPASRFVASFLGRTNWLRGSVVGSQGVAAQVRTEGGVLLGARPWDGSEAGSSRVEVALRPERLVLTPPDKVAAGRGWTGSIARVRFGGAVSFVEVATDQGETLEVLSPGRPPAPGARVGVVLAPGDPPAAFPFPEPEP